MTEFTPKISLGVQDRSDSKKSYAHPDVIDLLSVDETEQAKSPAPFEDIPGTNFGQTS
jgi:hypothetical protein